MENENIGLADWFVARHTTDDILRQELTTNQNGSRNNRPAERLTESTSPYTVESVESTNGSLLAAEQACAVFRATTLMHRVMEERSQRTEHEQFLREMHRRETDIRERISRTRIEREQGKIGKGWRKWQEAIPGPWCACLNDKISEDNRSCRKCGRQKYMFRGSATNREFGPTESVDSFVALEQRVEGACAILHGAPRERIEREDFGRAIERKEREIRAERQREKSEKDAREQWEASRWPQEQEAIPGPQCTCSNEPSQESAQVPICGQCHRLLLPCATNHSAQPDQETCFLPPSHDVLSRRR